MMRARAKRAVDERLSAEIERNLRAENWRRAEVLARRAVELCPDSHWFLARLSNAQYEQRKYAEARRTALRGLAIQPTCPLLLWDLAGAEQMLDRDTQAIAIYRRLLNRGVNRLAFGKCDEGLVWACEMHRNCMYRLAQSLLAKGDPVGARKWIRRYMSAIEGVRAPLYTRKMAKRLELQLEEQR